jgi:hypothetical protein
MCLAQQQAWTTTATGAAAAAAAAAAAVASFLSISFCMSVAGLPPLRLQHVPFPALPAGQKPNFIVIMTGGKHQRRNWHLLPVHCQHNSYFKHLPQATGAILSCTWLQQRSRC